MNDKTNSEIGARLASLASRFAARCEIDRREILAALEEPICALDIELIHERVHRLAGSASMLGFDDLGNQAREVDELMSSDPEFALREAGREALSKLLELLPSTK